MDKFITLSEEPKPTIDRSIDQRLSIQWYEDQILWFDYLSKCAFKTENVEEFSSCYKLLYLESLLNKLRIKTICWLSCEQKRRLSDCFLLRSFE